MHRPTPLPKRTEQRAQRKPFEIFLYCFFGAIGLSLVYIAEESTARIGIASFVTLLLLGFERSIRFVHRRQDAEDRRRLGLNRDFWRAPAESLGLDRTIDEDVIASSYEHPRLSGVIQGVHVQAAVVRYRSGDNLYDAALITVRLDEPWVSLDFERSGFSGQAKSLSRLGQTGLTGDPEFDRRWSVSSHLQEQALTHLAPEARAHFNLIHDAPWAQGHLLKIAGHELHLRYQSQYELRAEQSPRWIRLSKVSFEDTDAAIEANIRAVVEWTRELIRITEQCERSLQARLARDTNAAVRAEAFKFVNDGYLNDGPKTTLLRAGCQSPYLETRIRCAEALGDEATHILEEAQTLLASKQGALALSKPAERGELSLHGAEAADGPG